MSAKTKSVDVTASINPRPFWANPKVTQLIPCANGKWQRMTELAKARDVEFTDRLAKIGVSNPDRDNALCNMQMQQSREGYMLVRVCWNIYGFCVRDTLNDGAGVLWSGKNGDGTAEGALHFAAEWHARDIERREVILSGYFPEECKIGWGNSGPTRNLRSEMDAALARIGGAP
jgi:hypothetical protein